MSSIVFRFVPSPTGNMVGWLVSLLNTADTDLWEAKLAGQLKTLSHSGHRYSMWTIMEHLTPGHHYCTLSVLSSLCSPVLCQTKGIIVDLFTESTDVVSDLVLYLGQLLLGFLRHFDNIKLWVNVA